MKSLLSIFALLTVTLMVITFVGCGGEEKEEDKGPVPEVTVAIPSTVYANTDIVATFSKTMDPKTVAVKLDGTAITPTTTDNTVFTFKPGKQGSFTLTITGKDTFGQSLKADFSQKIDVKAEDKVPPTIVDAKCDPTNGADGVDPKKYTFLTVTFSEAMGAGTVKVNKRDPDFKSVDELSADGLTFKMTFQKYEMPNETKFTIVLLGKDLAGNDLANGTYSFTTMKKQQ